MSPQEVEAIALAVIFICFSLLLWGLSLRIRSLEAQLAMSQEDDLDAKTVAHDHALSDADLNTEVSDILSGGPSTGKTTKP